MKNSRLLVLVVGASVVATAGVLVACSSDDAAIVVDAGADAPAPFDAGTSDAKVEELPFDAGFKPETYDTDLGKAACETLARCCFGNPNPSDGGVDGGSFDLEKCLADYRLAGYDSSNQDLAKADASVLVVDQVKASECVTAIRGLSCTVTGPTYKAMRDRCFDALYGKVPAGGSCNYSIECAPGHFCKTSLVDGGATPPGTCQPLRAADGACGDFTGDQYFADQACSYRGDGRTSRFCDNVDDFNTFKPREDKSKWTCQAALAKGENCTLNTWCASGLCDFNDNTCVDTLDLYPQSFCKFYVR